MRARHHRFDIKHVLAVWHGVLALVISCYVIPTAQVGHYWHLVNFLVMGASFMNARQVIKKFEFENLLKERYFAHESKRHFQVLQSLLYIEHYDEAKAYIHQVTHNQF